VRTLKAWWIGLMLNPKNTLTEKMTLFWPSHLVAQMFLMKDARFDYDYLALLRLHALGNFKKLTRAITTTPGMLLYLNGNSNSAVTPNENYARELQELFTVGKGPDSRYMESDVMAAARVLTGWEDHQDDLSSLVSLFNPNPPFNPLNHDSGDKQFSTFYNNTVIKGRTGAAGAKETDDLIDMIFQQQEAAKHVCRKIYRWFVYSEIDSKVEAEVISPLADLFFKNNFEVKPVLKALLGSEHFFDPMNRGCLIKNPVDFLIGACRQFQVPFPSSSELALQYDAWSLAYQLRLLGMEPGDPLNVAGWPAYHQQPGYHRLWINSNTLPLRNSFTDMLASEGGLPIYSAKLKFDLLAFTNQLPHPEDPNQLITDSTMLLCANAFDASQIEFLKTILLSGQKADYYWTDAWNSYATNPTDEISKSVVFTRLRQFYAYIAQRPEYQLI